MRSRNRLPAALLLLPLSSLGVACGGIGDSGYRTSLEHTALQRNLDLALRPDTTDEIALDDAAPLDTAAPEPAPPPPPPPPAPAAQAPRERPQLQRPAEPRVTSRTVPAGSTFTVRFDGALSTRDLSVGSPVRATLAQPLTDAAGRVAIPAGAAVRGEVTRAQHASRTGGSADLAVTFTSISHAGRSHPIRVTPVSAPPLERVGRQSTAETTAKVTGGAAVGAVAGRVVGRDRRSAVIGAGVGTLAGTALAVGTNAVDAVIPAGATATLRLDGAVQVRE